MQLEVQEFAENATVGKDGSITASGIARPVGPKKVSEFGVANDNITVAVGGGYTLSWNPDFLQKPLGKKGMCARFYFDKKVGLDVRNPNGHTANKKRQLLHENGFAYLCIPEDFPQDVAKLQTLYQHALKEYRAYEAVHPRPVVLQEALMVDEKGIPRKVKVTAIDTMVGGGVTGGSIADALATQQAEAEAAQAMTTQDLTELKQRQSTIKAIRKAKQAGQPFRNPFVGKKGQRLYSVAY